MKALTIGDAAACARSIRDGLRCFDEFGYGSASFYEVVTVRWMVGRHGLRIEKDVDHCQHVHSPGAHDSTA